MQFVIFNAGIFDVNSFVKFQLHYYVCRSAEPCMMVAMIQSCNCSDTSSIISLFDLFSLSLTPGQSKVLGKSFHIDIFPI